MPRPKLIETPAERKIRLQDMILLRACRNVLGISQRELAQRIGVHFTTIAKAESGHSRLIPAKMEALKAIYRDAGLVFLVGSDGVIRLEIGPKVVEMIAVDLAELYPAKPIKANVVNFHAKVSRVFHREVSHL